ncbi:MAG: methanogen output domain 1-containing protein [Gemmatimonadota bacterium]
MERDEFFREMLRELAGALEDIVGLGEAVGYVGLVGEAVGARLDAGFREELGVDRLDRDQVAAVLVELKRRIGGGFSVEQHSPRELVFRNHTCPFGAHVRGRPSLCMMTSNVFGTITANHLGYARVELEETIAEGAPGCRIRIFLQAGAAPDGIRVREYFGASAVEG